MSGANHPTSKNQVHTVDLLRRIQLSIDGAARNEYVSTWVSNELLKEAKAEIERLSRELAMSDAGGKLALAERGRLLAALELAKPWLVWGPDSPGPQWELNGVLAEISHALSGEPNSAPETTALCDRSTSMADKELIRESLDPDESLFVDIGQLLHGWRSGCGPGEWTDWDEQVLRRWDEWRTRSPEKADERPAPLAHGVRHCPTCGEELGEDGHHKPDPVPPLV